MQLLCVWQGFFVFSGWRYNLLSARCAFFAWRARLAFFARWTGWALAFSGNGGGCNWGCIQRFAQFANAFFTAWFAFFAWGTWRAFFARRTWCAFFAGNNRCFFAWLTGFAWCALFTRCAFFAWLAFFVATTIAVAALLATVAAFFAAGRAFGRGGFFNHGRRGWLFFGSKQANQRLHQAFEQARFGDGRCRRRCWSSSRGLGWSRC